MMREEVFKPSAGPIGALGISSETGADWGKDRRTTTKAPPAEMLMAVANSNESLPLPSRVRIKTGMASCNRAHLRSSFLVSLRDTPYSTVRRVISALEPHLRGQTLEVVRAHHNHPESRHQQGDYKASFGALAPLVTFGHLLTVQCFALVTH